MSVATSQGIRRGLRTLLQTIAGGGLTALVTVVANGLSPSSSLLVMAIFTALVAAVQNYLEGGGFVPVILPSPGLVSPVLGPVSDVVPIIAPVAEATVDAAVNVAGDVVGTVTDLGGGVIGTVTGKLADGLHSSDGVRTDDQV